MTSLVFDTLAQFGVEVLDIEQIVLRRRLILGLLVTAPRDWRALRDPDVRGRRPARDDRSRSTRAPATTGRGPRAAAT